MMKTPKSLWFPSLDFGLDIHVEPNADKDQFDISKVENEHLYIDGKSIPLSDFKNESGQTIGEFMQEQHINSLYYELEIEVRRYNQ